MKKLSAVLAATLLFAGISFAAPKQEKKDAAKEKKVAKKEKTVAKKEKTTAKKEKAAK